MGRLFGGIDGRLQSFLEAQPVFFVATAPSSNGGHVNLSPKGMAGTFRVIHPNTVAYLDLTGSGIETIAHLRENGRVTMMFCSFDGPPRIVRLYGQGEAVLMGDDRFADLAELFPPIEGTRAVIVVSLDRVADSCGYGVPRMTLVGDRDQLAKWARRKGAEGLSEYQRTKNATSIDGMPGLG